MSIKTSAALGLGLAVSVGLALVACGDDESSTSTAPKTPPGLSLVSVEGVGGPRWEPGGDSCVELGHDPKQTIAVVIGLSSFTLRPPGTCGGTRQCGTALLRVDPSGDGEALRVEAAQTTLAASFSALGPGSHTFRVELRDKQGLPQIDVEAGATLFSEVTLEVKEPGGCGGAVDSGSDATDAGGDDASGDAGSDAGGDAGDDGGGDADAAGTDASDAGDAGSEASADASDDGGDAGDAGTD